MSSSYGHHGLIKCVVWDLDDTLWRGVLLEGNVRVRDAVVTAVQRTDERGILQSIASKNDYHLAMARLREVGLDSYFLYPQISWAPKSKAFEVLARELNLSLDTFALIDDQEFERAEVAFAHPQVHCVDPSELEEFLASPAMNPLLITKESSRRRIMYARDQQRKQARDEFQGTEEEFLATLDLHFRIGPACEEDLKRAEELTVRTHQMNTTGHTYSYDELNNFRQSRCHRLLIAELSDRFGSYGKVGLALLECLDTQWTIKLLVVSCRVIGRGVGTVMINYILRLAKQVGVSLTATFRPTGRNRIMYMTYKLNGFEEVYRSSDALLLQHRLCEIHKLPAYIVVDD